MYNLCTLSEGSIMARFADKDKARTLRAQGRSYSEIKELLKVGKGTLSAWLADMPLTPEQMRQVRDFNPRRIERFRETMSKKRNARLEIAYEEAKKDIGKLSRRELLIAGLYLYWGDGNKSGHNGFPPPASVRQWVRPSVPIHIRTGFLPPIFSLCSLGNFSLYLQSFQLLLDRAP